MDFLPKIPFPAKRWERDEEKKDTVQGKDK